MLTINEIFYSIQGESTLAGEPCVFVRLTACDLRCSWCDTPYAFHEGRSEEHTSELQSHLNLVCRLLLEKKKNIHGDGDRSDSEPDCGEGEDHAVVHLAPECLIAVTTLQTNAVGEAISDSQHTSDDDAH